MSSRGRIVLGDDDFADDETTAQAAAPQAPAGPVPGAPSSLPPVARRAPLNVSGDPARNWGAGAPPAAAGPALPDPALRWLRDARVSGIAAAVVGIALAWAIAEKLGLPDNGEDATRKSALNAASGVFVGTIGLVFACVVLAFDRAVEGAWEEAGRRAARAAVPGFVMGFVSGYIAQAIFTKMLEDAIEAGSFEPGSARLYLARIIAWASFGLGLGATFGLVERAGRKAVNGAIGGLVGGAIGGALFHWAALNIDSAAPARLVGLLGVALLIAVAIRTVETVRREAWLHVLAGGMTGKEFILYHAVTRIGASPDCEIFLLKDPAVAKQHAVIQEHGAQRVLQAMDGATVYVNQTPVQAHQLRHGDQIQIGNTVIGYAERATAPPPVGVPR